MKKIKKALILSLSLVVFSCFFVCCGNKDNDANNGSASKVDTTQNSNTGTTNDNSITDNIGNGLEDVTDGVVNHNSLMNKFVFKVNLTRDETIAILLTKCVKDTLTCTFDFDMSTIVFSDFWDNEKYYLVISKCDKFSLLHLELVSFRARRSSIKYKITPFIVNKLNAEVVSFSEYGI